MDGDILLRLECYDADGIPIDYKDAPKLIVANFWKGHRKDLVTLETAGGEVIHIAAQELVTAIRSATGYEAQKERR